MIQTAVNSVTSVNNWDRVGLNAKIPLELSSIQVVCLQEPSGFFCPKINFYLVVWISCVLKKASKPTKSESLLFAFSHLLIRPIGVAVKWGKNITCINWSLYTLQLCWEIGESAPSQGSLSSWQEPFCKVLRSYGGWPRIHKFLVIPLWPIN